jgi:predicted permease
MMLPGELKRRFHMMLHRGRFRQELEEEIASHVEFRRQQLMAAGLPGEMAGAAARKRFGNTTLIQEKSQMAWGWNWLENLLHDTVYGVRTMLRSPGLTIVALVSLALGIGANTAIFSFIDAVMLRALPVSNPQQLVLLGTGEWAGISDGFAITELHSYPFYRLLQQENAVFSDTAAMFSRTNHVHGFVDSRTDSEPIDVQLVSGSYFPTLGVQAQLGRVLNEGDDNSEGDHPVVVISRAFWKRSLGADPYVLDRKLKLGNTIFNIVGVAPAEFFGTKVDEAPDAWAPLSMIQSVPPNWTGYKDNFSESLYIVGRLKPGVTQAEAETDINLAYQQILRGFPDSKLNQENLQKLARAHVALTPMANGISKLRREFSEPLEILMGVVGLVLLIACANIANLLLARSTTRARELAVRQALGAHRGRIVRQLLTESLLLAIAGGTLGVGLAVMADRVLLRMVSGVDTIPLDVSLNLRLLAFALTVTVATALLFGTLAAFRAARLELVTALKDGRSGASSSGARNPLAKVLIISQVSLSLVLMVGACLFLRTLNNLNQVDPGFNKESVLRLNIDSKATSFKVDDPNHDPRLNNLYKEIEDRVRALPGVQAASFSAFTFNEGGRNGFILVPGMPVNHELNVKHNIVGEDYFKVMQIPLIAGRTFGPQDTSSSPRVAVISEHMARTLFPADSPIGHSYHIEGPDSPFDEQVIGIVKDVKFGNLEENPEDIDYIPYTQRNWGVGDFEVRYTGDFNTIAREVQQAIHSIDRSLPIMHVTSLDEQVARSFTNERMIAQLSAFFGLLAVFLSCIGIYGLMSYVVSRRTAEIGVRVALGAQSSDVQWLVMREIFLLVSAGIAIGVPVTLLASKWVANMLYGLQRTDPISLAAAVVILVLAGWLAGYLPARRASRVDPVLALRYE